jgi:hypothetical protein
VVDFLTRSNSDAIYSEFPPVNHCAVSLPGGWPALSRSYFTYNAQTATPTTTTTQRRAVPRPEHHRCLISPA